MCQPARDHGLPPPTCDPERDQRQPDYSQRDQQDSPRANSARSHDRRRGRGLGVDYANDGRRSTRLMSPAAMRPGSSSAGLERAHVLCLRGRPASTVRQRAAGPRPRRRARARRGPSMHALRDRHGSMPCLHVHGRRVARKSGDAFGNRLRRRHRRSRGLRLRRRLNRRRRLGRRTRRQKRQWIDVPVRVDRPPDAEVHVGLGPFGLTARADGADDVAFAHSGPERHADRAEVDERDRPAVLGADRQAQPLVR